MAPNSPFRADMPLRNYILTCLPLSGLLEQDLLQTLVHAFVTSLHHVKPKHVKRPKSSLNAGASHLQWAYKQIVGKSR